MARPQSTSATRRARGESALTLFAREDTRGHQTRTTALGGTRGAAPPSPLTGHAPGASRATTELVSHQLRPPVHRRNPSPPRGTSATDQHPDPSTGKTPAPPRAQAGPSGPWPILQPASAARTVNTRPERCQGLMPPSITRKVGVTVWAWRSHRQAPAQAGCGQGRCGANRPALPRFCLPAAHRRRPRTDLPRDARSFTAPACVTSKGDGSGWTVPAPSRAPSRSASPPATTRRQGRPPSNPERERTATRQRPQTQDATGCAPGTAHDRRESSNGQWRCGSCHEPIDQGPDLPHPASASVVSHHPAITRRRRHPVDTSRQRT